MKRPFSRSVRGALAALPPRDIRPGAVTSDVAGVRPDAIVDLATDEGVSARARPMALPRRSHGRSRTSRAWSRTAAVRCAKQGVRHHAESGRGRLRRLRLGNDRAPGSGSATHNGRLSFGWYRISVTVPERVGGFDTAGVDGGLRGGRGRLRRSLGGWPAAGRTRADRRPIVKGFNAPNRVVSPATPYPAKAFSSPFSA